jgi:hypothetical protein
MVSWGRGTALLGAMWGNENEDDDRDDNNDDNDLYSNGIPIYGLETKILYIKNADHAK